MVDITPYQSETYEAGAIVSDSWGYDQTNIDFYVITKRSTTPKGDMYVTLLPMTQTKSDGELWAQGTCIPGRVKQDAKPFRRKVHVWNGEERGIAINSYGWCTLWDGKPEHWTAYA